MSLCLCVFLAGWLSRTTADGTDPGEKESPPSASSLNQWGSVTIFHGLPSDHVRAITQDSDGSMLFGTDEGLARYDGRRVQKLAGDGVAASRIRALKNDGNAVWIASDTGAAVLAAGIIKPISETAGYSITAIAGADRETVFVSEQGVIFFCRKNDDGSFSVHSVTPANQPLLNTQARDGRHAPLELTSIAPSASAWTVGSRSRGLLLITEVEPAEIREVACRPRPFFINAIASDERGSLWLGVETARGAAGLFNQAGTPDLNRAHAATGSVNALAFDDQHRLWAGSDGDGVFRIDGRKVAEHFTFEGTAGGLRSNRIYSVFADREGVIWFGTDRGISRYDPQGVRVELISSNPESNVARVLFQSSDHRFWCGTNRGLFVRRVGESQWRVVRELEGKTIHAISQDQSGKLFVGTAAGLFVSAKEPRSVRGDYAFRFARIEAGEASPADNIRAISFLRGVTYLANFGRGLERIEGERRVLVWPANDSTQGQRQVISLAADRTGRLWIGTAEEGVFVFDGSRVIGGAALDKLKGSAVWDLQAPTDETLLIATSRGLFAFDSGALVPVIDQCDTRSVVVTKAGPTIEGWCATAGCGTFRFRFSRQLPIASVNNKREDDVGRTSTGFATLVSRVDAERGLPSPSAFAVLAGVDPSSEELMIGTSRGIARYRPSRVAPELSLIRAIGKRAYTADEMRSGLTLEYPQNSMALDFAASSSRTFPEQFQYTFALTDERGRLLLSKTSREGQVALERLKPGKFRVLATAFDVDLLESVPLVLEFYVEAAPFPWTSTALATFLLMALVALLWGWRQNKRLAGANRELADTRFQLANETESERRRIARDLHDQTLADLRRVMMLSDQLPTSNASSRRLPDAATLREEIEALSNEIRRICEDLSPSALSNVGLAAALEWALADAVSHQPTGSRFEYEFVCDEDVESRLASTEQIHLYRIVQEGLSNICRHSGASRVRLGVKTVGDDGLVLELEDNGKGFELSNGFVGKGRGLVNIRSRASLLRAQVNWNRRPEGGTVLTLKRSAK